MNPTLPAADEKICHERVFGNVWEIPRMVVAGEAVPARQPEQTRVGLVAGLSHSQHAVISKSEVQTMTVVAVTGIAVVNPRFYIGVLAGPDQNKSSPITRGVSRNSVRHIEKRRRWLAANAVVNELTI